MDDEIKDGYVIFIENQGYYTGKNFVHHGEKFAICVDWNEFERAKIYKNQKIAERVAKNLFNRYVNIESCKVILSK